MFCALNPPVSPGVSRSSSLSERMAWWDIPRMPAACGMSEHMASLSSDNGEAEGSCPEPAGHCQPRCNSSFQGGPRFSIRTVLRAARLGHYHNGVTWEAGNRQGRGLSGRTNWLLSHYLAQRDRQSEWLEKNDSEQACATEGPRGHPACWAWGTVSALPSVSLTHWGRHFPTRSSAGPWPAARRGCPSARAPGPQCWRTLRVQTLWRRFVPKPWYFTLKSF